MVSGSWTGGRRRSHALARLNIEAFSATPIARVRTAIVVKPGDLRSMRWANLKSCANVLMPSPFQTLKCQESTGLVASSHGAYLTFATVTQPPLVRLGF